MSAWDSSDWALSLSASPASDDADAGPHVEAAAAHRDRLLDGLDQPLGDGPQVSGRAVHEVGELVPAEPRDGVAAAHQAGQPLPDDGQHHVPGGVPVPVVDHLEVVEVEEKQAELPVRPGQLLLDPLHQQGPVREPGERVVVGLVLQPGGELAALAHVVQREDGALEGPLGQLPDGTETSNHP